MFQLSTLNIGLCGALLMIQQFFADKKQHVSVLKHMNVKFSTAVNDDINVPRRSCPRQASAKYWHFYCYPSGRGQLNDTISTNRVHVIIFHARQHTDKRYWYILPVRNVPVFYGNGLTYCHLQSFWFYAGMGSSRTVLELEDSSRTQNRGLGFGL